MLFDVLDRLGAGIFVYIEHDEAQRHLKWRAVGHVTLLTFLNIVFRLFELVLDVFKHGGLIEIFDRENRLENACDTFTIGGGLGVAGIQEQIVRGFLNLDEVRHLQHFADFAVIFTQTFLAKEGLCHVSCHLSCLLPSASTTGAVVRAHKSGKSGSILGMRPTASLPTMDLSREML